MRWDDDAGRWLVSTNRGDELRARFVCMANGPLHRPKLPGIPGIETFAGPLVPHQPLGLRLHRRRLRRATSTGLRGKRVGIIGTGRHGGAVRAPPRRGRRAAVRVPAHAVVDRRPRQPADRSGVGGEPRAGLAEAADGELQHPRHRRCSSRRTSSTTAGPTSSASCCVRCARPTSPTSARAASPRPSSWPTSRRWSRSGPRVDTIVNDPNTAEALKPYYRQFCKRPCFHDEYLDTFNRPNVTLVDTDGKGVDRITERGVVVGETEFELDCLIYATGFEVGTDYTRRAGYEVVGRDGLTLTREVGRRRVDAARHAHARVPELLHLQPPRSPASRSTSRTCSTSRASTPPTSCATPSTTTCARSRHRRRPRMRGWRRSSSWPSSTSTSSSRARPATTTTRASRASAACATASTAPARSPSSRSSPTGGRGRRWPASS